MIIDKEVERKPYGYWTKERCKEESLKYSNRKEFKMLSKSAYAIVQRNGWSNELCSHMSYLGSLLKRFIYLYTFTDNSIYIGLTYNIEERNRNHLSGQCDSRVYDYIKPIKIKNKSIEERTKFLFDKMSELSKTNSS